MSARTIDDRIREDINEPGFAQEFAEVSEDLDLSIKLAQLRKSKGLTQQELADLIGVKKSYIARIETPGYTNHSLCLLKKIAKAYNMVVRVDIINPKVKHWKQSLENLKKELDL